MAKVYIHPPNSLILFDLVRRFGHTPLGLGEEVSKNVNKPEIDSPPMNITPDFPRKGLKYVAIEVPSGVRGRLALIGPLIEEADAAIIVDDPEVGFGCTSCGRANEFLIYLVKQRGIPYIVVPYPYTEEEAKIMVSEIKKFLASLH
ncbi:MAG: methanogenesis marker 5 protein [Candidatus Methanomethyliaceae archaeon]|nr:methanogenesis marker 5 protein [Candidatus Methanomethyliaceae archaeon]MDW7970859.1 methanogenesis marker 5 protein [Nitrososphaerota archaeon]